MFSRSVRATRSESGQPLPGDELIPKPVGSLTHAVTIRRPPHGVWPWLAQMGAGSRAWSAAGVGLIAGGYVAYVALTWARYGRVRPPSRDEEDRLLDRFMPAYDIVDRHCIRVEAPAAVTLAIARDMELFQLPVVRAIVRGRELVLRAGADDQPRPRGLLAEAQSLGWGVLAEGPGREIVVGAVTKPWEANVTFRSVPAEEFAAFAEPDYVKIAWTLRADPVDDGSAVFRTETRVIPTDATARAKFRRYWPFLSPGIKLIRRMSLREVRAQAARRGRFRSDGTSSSSSRSRGRFRWHSSCSVTRFGPFCCCP